MMPLPNCRYEGEKCFKDESPTEWTPSCDGCEYLELPKSPKPEQAEASSLSAGLCCPWGKYIKESDGNFKDFGAWERWLNELDDAILEDMEIELRSSLYGIMIDMLKAT